MKTLDGSQRIQIVKAITKVKQNPLPADENGYGKPLGNHNGSNLSNFLKIKLKSSGLRVVYKLVRTQSTMLIVVIGIRDDEEGYEIAQKRAIKHNLLL